MKAPKAAAALQATQPLQEEEVYWNPSMKTVSPEDMQAFALRMHNRMVELGMTQARLAEKAFGSRIVNGKKRIIDGDKISLYLSGKGLPGETKMRQLAGALEMSLRELAPPISTTPRERLLRKTESVMDAHELTSTKMLEIRSLPNGMALLLVNQVMSAVDAAEIAATIARAAKHGR